MSYLANLEKYLTFLEQDPKCSQHSKNYVVQQIAAQCSLPTNLTKSGFTESGRMGGSTDLILPCGQGK